MKSLRLSLAIAAFLSLGGVQTADAATATGNFQVRITITESCSFSTAGASDLDFGDKARASAGDVADQGSLVVNCTQGTPYNIGLNQGTGAGATTSNRKMTSAGGDTVGYSLYRDGALTQNWGDTVGVDTQPGTGTGSDQTVPVYGRVLGGSNVNVPAGQYSDTIVATITY